MCSHPQSNEIAAALARGETLLALQNQYGMGYTAISRHRTNCLKVTPAEVMAANNILRKNKPHPAAVAGRAIIDVALPTRNNLIGRLEQLSERVDAIASSANDAGREGVALAGLSEIRKTIADIARIAGHDRPAVAVQINNGPGAAEIASTVLDLLRQALPPDQQVTLLPTLAQRLKSLAGPGTSPVAQTS